MAESVNGVILAINTDRGSQLYANKKSKKGKGKSQFQIYLEKIGIKHISSKGNNPQTNGKLERWGREYKQHRDKFETAEAFAAWYNRIHRALNLEIGETPEEAFMRKLRREYLKYVVDTRELSKFFDKIKALSGISFQIPPETRGIQDVSCSVLIHLKFFN